MTKFTKKFRSSCFFSTLLKRGSWIRVPYKKCLTMNFAKTFRIVFLRNISGDHLYIFSYSGYIPLRKIPKFHLISLCGNFLEMHSLLRNLSDTWRSVFLVKLQVAGVFLFPQKIGWNFAILRSVQEYDDEK